MGVFTNLMRGYRGGPDFAHCETIQRRLENWQLQWTTPCTNIAAAPDNGLPHFPFKQPEWYDENAKMDGLLGKRYIHLDTQLWYYVRPLTLQPDNFYNCHSLSVQLQRIDNQPSIDIFNLNQLGNYFCANYENNYATRLQPRLDEERTTYYKFHPKGNETVLQGRIERSLGPLLTPPAPSFEISTFKDTSWLTFHQPEHQLGISYPLNVYVQPLEENFVLCMRFRYEISNHDLYKKTKKVMLETEHRILESLSLMQLGSTV